MYYCSSPTEFDNLHIKLYQLLNHNFTFEKPCVILLCNFFNRYMNGAASNPDAHAFAHAAAQVKKGLEMAKKLGAENFGTFNQTCRHLAIVLFIS